MFRCDLRELLDDLKGSDYLEGVKKFINLIFVQ